MFTKQYMYIYVYINVLQNDRTQIYEKVQKASESTSC